MVATADGLPTDMSTWMNDAAAVQNHNGGGFNPLDSNPSGAMLDPSAFMSNPTAFDPSSQFQNQQLQQRMQNGAMRNGAESPGFSNPQYQTNQVIPSKRPRPREDSLGMSPRQAPGMLPNSRSQTPQQNPYPGGFPSSAPQQHPSQGAPYSHLQNGSANASPSPIMANQLRPGGVPQRVSTSSPHPFSPAAQQFPQPSPSQSEHGSRVDTPQNNNPYPSNPNYPQAYGQSFTPPPGRSSAPPQNAMSTPQMQQSHMPNSQMYQQAQQQAQQRPQTMEQQKMIYQMQVQRQMQQQNLMAAQRGNMPANVNPMAKAQMQAAQQNGQQFPGMRQPQQQQPPGLNTESFLKGLQAFMAQRNLPLEMHPIVCDRPIPLITLYMTIKKFGGYKKVTGQNGWSQIALTLQFNPMQAQTAGQQIKVHYESYLALFDEAWQMNQQRQRAAAMMQQNPNAAGAGPQMSPTKPMNPQAMQQQQHQFMQQQALMQQQQLQQQRMATPVKQLNQTHQPSINGYSTPQPPGQPRPTTGSQSHSRNSLSKTMDATPPQNGTSFTMPSPVSVKPGSHTLHSPQVGVGLQAGEPPASREFNLPDQYDPKVRTLDTWGGVNLTSLSKMGTELMHLKPDIPPVAELGAIDIHALTMSLQSGIHAEVRMALDTIVSLSLEPRLVINLLFCDDLVEVLIDCAEEQVEFLAASAPEVSDDMLVTSYEDVLRGCRAEQDLLQDINEFGTDEYELDRAVDRLICVTTILRNLSFVESNYPLLADELVIKFLCVVIRYLGTRNMLLRTNKNTLDFMKDIIVFLSNVSQAIELPRREQALCLLHFLLAFAPCPPPNQSERVNFLPYDPAMHRYLPPAIDSLAKLLARDEPNRTHYKTIFASDVASSPPYDLLTRTFGLSISALPDGKADAKRGVPTPIVEARKPMIMQGILAAEVLSNLAPGFESGLARSWLTSDDGFAQNLSRLVLSLCLETTPAPPTHSRGAQTIPKGVEDESLHFIAMRGIAVLRKLGEKSKDPDDPTASIPSSGLPAKESLLQALRIVQPDKKVQGVLKALCAYAGLGS